MMINHEFSHNCCDNSDNYTKILSFPASPISTIILSSVDAPFGVYPWSIYICDNCGFCVNDFSKYSGDVYDEDYPETGVNLPNYFNDLIARIVDSVKHIEYPFILDIGCNDGSKLKKIREIGERKYKLLGIEASPGLAQCCSDNSIEVINGYFDDSLISKIKDDYGVPDIIICSYVLEHVPDPVAFLQAIAALMNEQSVLLLEFPCFDIHKKIGGLPFLMKQHINYITVNDAHWMLSRVNLKITEREVFSYSGGISTLCCKVDVAAFCDERIVSDRDELIEFAARTKKCIEYLVNLLDKYKLEGKRISAFGVGARGVSIINNAGIGDYLEYVIDDAEFKIGKYIPTNSGKALPIYSSEILHSSQATDVCLFLPFSSKELERKVLAKHKSFLQNGNIFVEFYPGEFDNPSYFLKEITKDDFTLIYKL